MHCRIFNGKHKALNIARIAIEYEAGLKAEGYGKDPSPGASLERDKQCKSVALKSVRSFSGAPMLPFGVKSKR